MFSHNANEAFDKALHSTLSAGFMKLQSRICSPAGLTAQESDAWDKFWSRQEHCSPFMSRHFALAVESAGVDVRVAVLMDGTFIAGFFAYQFPSRQRRFMRFGERVGGGLCDFCGVVLAENIMITPHQLLELSHLDRFDFSHLHPNQGRLGLSGGQGEVGHFVALKSPGVEYWNSFQERNKRLYKDTNRCFQKLQREIGTVCFSRDVESSPQLLQGLIDLKRDQYKRTGAIDALAEGWKLELIRQLYDKRFEQCRGVLSVLSAGGNNVAMHFGLVGGQTLHYWFPVYDGRYSSYSPGRLLYRFLIESMDEFSCRILDNGAGDAAYKAEVSNDSYQVQSGRWYRSTSRAFVSMAASSIQWRYARLRLGQPGVVE